MKITKQQLKKIIKEEVSRILLQEAILDDIDKITFPERKWQPSTKDKKIIKMVVRELMEKHGVEGETFYNTEALKKRFFALNRSGTADQIFDTAMGGGRGIYHVESPWGPVEGLSDLAELIGDGLAATRPPRMEYHS